MDIDIDCTICGASEARRCDRCHSAAYCSIECQQTDWLTHRFLCSAFSVQAQDNFRNRPSPKHHLAILFPMNMKKPHLVWVAHKKQDHEYAPYFHPILDHFLYLPGGTKFVDRDLRQIRGNTLRGRPRWQNTIHLWFLSSGVVREDMITNQSIHGFYTSLLAGTLRSFMWEGPIVAILRKGSDFEPRHSIDITLTAYRDVIDYLGFYRDDQGGSVTDPVEVDHYSNLVLSESASKVIGVRVNCLRDQIDRKEPQMVEVAVPKMHPLFNVEGDDPFCIPLLFGIGVVAKSYSNLKPSDDGTPLDDALQNPLAQLLTMTHLIEGGKWVWSQDRRRCVHQGSILLVRRSKKDIAPTDIQNFCSLIEETAVPFMLKEDASSPGAEERLLSELKQAGARRGLEYYGTDSCAW